MSSVDFVDAVVVGAGVVGLAVARSLAATGRETLILERHSRFGEETSSRNSGVVHSGIYYPTGSLKAELCVLGREMLYSYAEDRGIRHRRCGKLIVAQVSQVAALRALRDKAAANGVNDLRWLRAEEAGDLEPAVRCAAALFSPSTGIIDVHEFMTSLLGDVEARGGTLVTNARAHELRPASSGLEITVDGGGFESVVRARQLINAAGLDAVALTRNTTGYPAELIPATYLAKGSYFSCAARPFRHLVYPMPQEAGLGIHATLDLDGSTRFGPDVEWVDRIDYAVDVGRAAAFYASIREYWPALPDGGLQPAYSGIRPKISGPGRAPADFIIAGPREHGIDSLINLLGIESRTDRGTGDR